MSIRIDRIKVNRGGPLRNDFILEPGDINLIYGHNETGKTYIIESIINLLLRTGKKSNIDWALREWDLSGSIIVSGLQDRPISFTRTGRKLEDYWEENVGLPQDFSRLLVVKAGETLLSGEEDGVGRNILKNYLSAEGLLDRIQDRISITLQETKIQDKKIRGPSRGEIKTREEFNHQKNELDSILKKAEDSYASGEVYSLRQQRDIIQTELDALRKAKCYHAALLSNNKKALIAEREGFPSDEDLSKIESEISIYERSKGEIDRKSDTLIKLAIAEDNYRWAEKAHDLYKEITTGQILAGPKPFYGIIAILLFAAVIVTGFLKLSIPLAISAAGTLLFSILYFLGTRHALAKAGSSKELEKLQAEFKTRYGIELTNMALLQTQVEKLREDYYRADNLRRELGELIPSLNIQERNITGTLKKYTGGELKPQQWSAIVSELRITLKNLNREISSLDVELASLAVSGEDFLQENPGTEWNPGRYKYLEEELNRMDKILDEELQKLENLKARIAQETRLDSPDWEDLITALREKRENVANSYKFVTADILAKVQVYAVIQEFREQENERIATGLKSEELTRPLHAITGCYKGIRHEADRGLILTTDEDEEYPLVALSTGAREQAFLAMRMGFSSIMMKGQTAFLILDDAFQHSDWPRRANLVNQILMLVKSGWQVFYFTMDDHIKELFLKAGKQLKDRFRSLELI